MATPKKTTTAKTKKTTKTAPDVSEPGKSAPPATSKPVIVTNRPVLKDPMVVTDSEAKPSKESTKPDLKHATGPIIQPLEGSTDNKPEEPATEEAPAKPEEKPEPPKEEIPSEPEPTPEAAPSPEPEEPKPKTGEAKPQPKTEAADEADKQRLAAVQHLIDGGKYELPINAVEKRKTKRFIVLGILLVVLLVLAWVNIAIDAGLLHIDGVQPVTNFF